MTNGLPAQRVRPVRLPSAFRRARRSAAAPQAGDALGRKDLLERLDKYLKVSRLIKRRTVANEACDNGLVTVNGKPARASYEVKVGDEISLRFGARTLQVEVVSVQETVKQADAAALYGRSAGNISSPGPIVWGQGRDDEMNDFNAMPAAGHRLELEGREHLRVSGVEDVERFDETGIVMSTSAGTLVITGEDLHIGKLSLDGGELHVDGRIDSVSYEDGGREQGGFFRRLFG